MANRRGIYFFLFALSGFSGLIYESIWTHYLKLFLGHAAYAQTLVLAIFMGGMAIGSWICSRYSGRWNNLLLGYAVTEGIIGLCALVFHVTFSHTIELSYASILPRLGNPAVVSAFKWTLSALMILPQSILLGMTFPLMSSGILRLFRDNPGRSIAMLYFSNSIGAAFGVLASGFLLIRLTGLPGTICIAGIINLGLALSIWLMIKNVPPAEDRFQVKTDTAPHYPGKSWYRLFLLASLVTGTASFIYEIGWIRMLSLVLGASTHAFELMLSSFILGLAFGGLWIQRRIDQVASPVRYLAQVQVFMGVLALSTLLLYGNTFEVMQWIVKTLPKSDSGYALFNLSSSAIAMGIMLPTTFCAGMTLPLITFILIREGHGERSIGAVYAANTIGAIIGIFFAIHLGMPLLGLKGLITFGACLDIALGVALLWGAPKDVTAWRKPVVVTAIGVAAVAGTLAFVKLDPYKMASGVYRFGALLDQSNCRLLYHKDGKTATVSVMKNADGTMAINTNGKTDAAITMDKGMEATQDESTMILLAAIPMALNSHATSAASIGLGSGLTSHALLANPLIRRLDTIEIEKGMIAAANNFRPLVERLYSDPRSRIYNEDAKTFFSTYNKKYDLIVSEPSNPWVSGVAGLFSEEFYRLIRHHMNADGLFVQWVQLYEINVDLVVSVLKAVSANFSDYAVYAPHNGDMIIVAKKTGLLPEPDTNLLKTPALAELLHRIHVEGEQDIALRRIGTKKVWSRLLDSFPIRPNSDYYPVLDQNAARNRFMGNSAQALLNFARFPLPTLEMLTGQNSTWRETAITPSNFYNESLAALNAMALRDYFLHGAFNPRYITVTKETKLQAEQVKALFYSCADQRTQSSHVGALLATAIPVIPYLTPSELDSIWKTLEAGPCAATISPNVRQMIALLRAVGNRDASGMYSSAVALLENSGSMTPGTVKYLVGTAMLGAAAKGNHTASQTLWSKYHSVLFGDHEPDLLFRMLAAER